MAPSSIVQNIVAPNASQKEREFLNNAEGARTGTFTPDNMPAGADRIVGAVRRLFTARTMQDFCEVMPILSRDIVWDAPPILTSRKGHLRVAAYLAKFVGSLDFEPALVNVKHLGRGRHLVEITGTVRFFPKRSWLLLPTLLLPQSIPIRSTVKVGVNGSMQDGQIELIYGQWHNLPSLPSPLRNLTGLFGAALPHMLEPVWSRAMEFVGDDFYKRKRERSLADGTAGPVDHALDFGSTTINSVGDFVSGMVNSVLDTANKVADTGRQYADTTVQTARDTARSAADTASGIARSTYETVMPSEVDTTLRKDIPATDKARELAARGAGHTKEAARSAQLALDPSGAQAVAR
ncbi:MAG: hypothetical protein J3K34DRAFT_462306 [Monoraphidium minutum]|nr:MAG: hypothetical protein J3K34DRAFT_462306 [Monoraphidium minutum]